MSLNAELPIFLIDEWQAPLGEAVDLGIPESQIGLDFLLESELNLVFEIQSELIVLLEQVVAEPLLVLKHMVCHQGQALQVDNFVREMRVHGIIEALEQSDQLGSGRTFAFADEILMWSLGV